MVVQDPCVTQRSRLAGAVDVGVRPGVQRRATLEWIARVDHGIVSYVRARLIACVIAKNAAIPRCQVEVWAFGVCPGTAGSSSEEELAYCKAVVKLGNPQAHVAWLGRSKGREIHGQVRGNACVFPCKLSTRACTIAQMVFGIMAGIVKSFGAEEIELVAEDNGTGRLRVYYMSMGLGLLEHVQGHAWRMHGPIEYLILLAPSTWIEALLPRDFSGRGWLRKLLQAPPPESLDQLVLARPFPPDPTGILEPMSSSAAVKMKEEEAALPKAPVSNASRHDSLGHSVVSRRVAPVPAWVPEPVASSMAVKAKQQKMALPASPTSKAPRRESSDQFIVSRRVALAPTETNASPATVNAIERGSGRLEASTSQATGARNLCQAAPALAWIPQPIVSSAAAEINEKSVAPSSPPAVSPAPVGHWSWNVSWPPGSKVSVCLSQVLRTRRGALGTWTACADRLRVVATLFNQQGVELTQAFAALPPGRRFMRIVWLGRKGGQGAHSLVRAVPVYVSSASHDGEISSDNGMQQAHHWVNSCTTRRVTASMGLLGALAVIAIACGAEVIELLPPAKSPQLLRYLFEQGGFTPTRAPRGAISSAGVFEDKEDDYRLEVQSEQLARRCCPDAWLEELPPAKPSQPEAHIAAPPQVCADRPKRSLLHSSASLPTFAWRADYAPNRDQVDQS